MPDPYTYDIVPKSPKIDADYFNGALNMGHVEDKIQMDFPIEEAPPVGLEGTREYVSAVIRPWEQRMND